jgi:antitoxin CptB
MARRRWAIEEPMTNDAEIALDRRRRRLVFRAWHRGTRETDLILGRFADAHAAGFSEYELADFERILEIPDPDIFAWVTGAVPVPEGAASPTLRRLIAFYGRTS